MKTASKLLFWFILSSAIYLLAFPQLQPEVGAASHADTQYEQAGKYRRGWPLTYLAYVSEHGDSKSTFYDFQYSYQSIRPVSLVVNISIFATILLALFRYPVITSKQLWIATAFFFLIALLLSVLIAGSFNEQNLNAFNVRILGPDRAIHVVIFSALAASLFFILARLVAIFESLIRTTDHRNANIAR